MNSNTFRTPARRLAATAAATALAAGPAALAGAVPAHATEGEGGGRASAVVLRADLGVGLLNKTVDVPLTTSLNEVTAPAGTHKDAEGTGRSAEKNALTVDVDGVDQGRPFSMLKAEVATSKATAGREKAEGHTNLANAQVHLPGLPAVPLVELEKVKSSAVCVAGQQPQAESNLLGTVNILGQKTKLSAEGTTKVKVDGIGEVSLALSKTHTTSRTAAASALELKVSVNPLKLNVAEVEGEVTLAGATCEAPKAAPAPAEPSAPAEGDHGTEPQGGADDSNLAETGGSSATPYLAGGAVALVAVGGGALYVARRGKKA